MVGERCALKTPHHTRKQCRQLHTCMLIGRNVLEGMNIIKGCYNTDSLHIQNGKLGSLKRLLQGHHSSGAICLSENSQMPTQLHKASWLGNTVCLPS